MVCLFAGASLNGKRNALPCMEKKPLQYRLFLCLYLLWPNFTFILILILFLLVKFLLCTCGFSVCAEQPSHRQREDKIGSERADDKSRSHPQAVITSVPVLLIANSDFSHWRVTDVVVLTSLSRRSVCRKPKQLQLITRALKPKNLQRWY